MKRPGDILFLDTGVYAWRALDELAVSAYYVGRYEESLRASNQLLSENALPERERARVEENRRFSLEKLGDARHKQRNKTKQKRRR